MLLSHCVPVLALLGYSTRHVPRAGELRCAADVTPDDFSQELKRRGLQTALDALEADGPSAFKNPTKVIEYVMLQLQHRSDESGTAEAFRFSCREPGKSSFVSGEALSSKRVSWSKAKVISGYVSGAALTFEEFDAELRETYAFLLGCAQWRFAVCHPVSGEPLARSAQDDFVREYVIVVDETPVSVLLLYDWGSWCYHVCSVRVVDGDVQQEVDDAGTRLPDPDSEGGRKRGRGGSI